MAAPTGQLDVSPSMSDQPGPYTNGTNNFLVSNGLVTEETFTLPPGTGAFYVYAGWECNCGGGGGPPQPISITATAQDGTSSGPVSVALGHPSYFGFYAACGSSVQTVELSVTGQQWTLTDGAFGIAPVTCAATQVGCNYQFATLNDVCTATVSSGTSVSPTGTVAFTSTGGGVFTGGTSCALSPVAATPGIANCSVTYVPPATGSPTVTASYGGDANNPPSSGTTNTLLPQNVAVAIVHASISPSAFIAALTGPPATFSRAPGAIVRFTLKAPAVVRFTVQRPEQGRKAAKGACQPVSRRNARQAHCTRWVTLHGRFTRKPTVGTNKFRFRGRIGGKTLKPGRYHLVGTPSIAGVIQKHVVMRFSVK